MRLSGLLLVLACFAVVPARAATLAEMAGQMVMVGFQGDAPDAAPVAAVRKLIAEGRVGGVMYLRYNVKSLSAVKAMNRSFRDAAGGPPPLIALDQEGGAIERLTKTVGFKEIPSSEAVARTRTPAEAEALYADLARRLAALGFNVNFGPVVDLNINPDNPIIARYGRSFGKSADVVSAYASAFIRGHHAAGLVTTLKHFPGHGSSTKDSHEGFVDITRTWKKRELDPYRTLVGRGLADMVMVGHLYHADYVADKSAHLPASLSPNWIEGILRKQIGFDGVAITDDMEMGAIRKHFSLDEAVARAVMAGEDILLFSNTAHYHAGLAGEIVDILVRHAKANPAFAARIRQSYDRILALKARISSSR